MNLYPMKTLPVPGVKSWGGNRIYLKYGIGDPKEKTGECILLSGNSRLAEGSLKGLTVNQVAARYPTEFSGRDLKMFPHALKLVDTQHAVPPKIHSDRHGIGGAWSHYEIVMVLDAQPGAGLYAGLRDQLTQESYETLLEKKEIRGAMNFLRVHTGDLFMIPAGLLHALGGGIVALVLSMGVDEQYKTDEADHAADWNDLRHNVRCLKFSGIRTKASWGEIEDIMIDGYIHTRKLTVSGTVEIETGEEASAIFIVSGKGRIKAGEETLPCQAGDTFVFAAENDVITIDGSCKCCVFG